MTDAALFAFAIAFGGYADFCKNEERCAKPPRTEYAALPVGKYGMFTPERPATIFVHENVKRGTAEEQAIKVHEYVHYLQYWSRRYYPQRICFGKADMEREAYGVQEKFAKTKGLSYGTAIAEKVASLYVPCHHLQALGQIK